jgi:hypothetical protein
MFKRLALLLSLVLVGMAHSKEDSKKADVGTVIGIDLGTTYSW